MSSALAKLAKERPTTEDIVRCLKELENDSARSCIALASALLEDLLRLVLVLHMRDLSKDEHNKIFFNSGPLASFSSKILFASGFSLINKRVQHDLDTIREIRNIVVHTTLKIDFDTKEVVALINGLHANKVLKALQIANLKNFDTPRQKFVGVVSALMIHMITNWSDPATDGIPEPLRTMD